MPEWLIMPFEKNIPMIPAFMIFYFGCFAWWVIAFLVAKSDRVYTQFFVFFPCYLICAICFVIFPFKIEWSEITGTGFFYDMVRFLRVIDKVLLGHCQNPAFVGTGKNQCTFKVKLQWVPNGSEKIKPIVKLPTWA